MVGAGGRAGRNGPVDGGPGTSTVGETDQLIGGVVNISPHRLARQSFCRFSVPSVPSSWFPGAPARHRRAAGPLDRLPCRSGRRIAGAGGFGVRCRVFRHSPSPMTGLRQPRSHFLFLLADSLFARSVGRRRVTVRTVSFRETARQVSEAARQVVPTGCASPRCCWVGSPDHLKSGSLGTRSR